MLSLKLLRAKQEKQYSCDAFFGLRVRAAVFIAGALFGRPAFSQQVIVNPRSHFVMKGNAVMVLKNASLKNNGSFVPGTGTVKFTGTGDTAVSFISGDNSTAFHHLFVDANSAGVAIRSSLSVTDSVLITGGNLFSNGKLTLKSTATGTAVVAALPVDGSGNAASLIKGNVTVERHIPARKAWRLLAAPLSASNAPTINASWQEGATTSSMPANPAAGFGTHITGGSVANGFDQGVTANPSLKIYSNTANSWSGIASTNMPVSSYPGYFLYVRGDRGIDLLQGVNAATTGTTLRMQGHLKSGTQIISINALNYTVVGNPFAAPIDFHSIVKTNVGDKLYLWDPKMSGTNGLGAYVTLSWNTNTLSYDATSSVSPVSRYIPSGEAFIVKAENPLSPGSLVIREIDKKNAGSDQVFGRINSVEPSVRVDMFGVAADSSTQLLDGVLNTYSDSYSNSVTQEDALKMTGTGEMIALRREEQLLTIERRQTIAATDTLFLHIYQMRVGKYRLRINISDMGSGDLIAVLKDNYAPATNNLPLNLSGISEVTFDIVNVPGAYAPDRFRIEFIRAVVVPVTFKSIKAYPVKKDIAVEWQTENEAGLESYDVERSANGVAFNKLRNVAVNFSGSGHYKIADGQPLPGTNYYRIKSLETTGACFFSRIVTAEISSQSAISIFPNPVSGNSIDLYFVNQPAGNYQLLLQDFAGKIISTTGIVVTGDYLKYLLPLNTQVAPGLYRLEIIRPDKSIEIKKINIQ